MLDAAVPVSCIHIPAPAVRHDRVGAALHEVAKVVLVGTQVVQAVAAVHQGTSRGPDNHAVVRMEGTRSHEPRVGRAECDTAALVVETLCGNGERISPDALGNRKGIRTAHALDGHYVFAGFSQLGEVQFEHIRSIVVALVRVLRLVGSGFRQAGAALGDRLAVRRADHREVQTVRIVLRTTVAAPAREKRDLGGIGWVKADVRYVHGLASQAGCIQGQRHRRQGRAREAKFVVPVLVQRKGKLQIDHALGRAIELPGMPRPDAADVAGLGLAPDSFRLHDGLTTRVVCRGQLERSRLCSPVGVEPLADVAVRRHVDPFIPADERPDPAPLPVQPALVSFAADVVAFLFLVGLLAAVLDATRAESDGEHIRSDEADVHHTQPSRLLIGTHRGWVQLRPGGGRAATDRGNPAEHDSVRRRAHGGRFPLWRRSRVESLGKRPVCVGIVGQRPETCTCTSSIC